MSLRSYMSYQHHAGLQPANLVTIPYPSRRRLCMYVCMYCPSFVIICLLSTVYDRTTVLTSDVSYVPYEIFQNYKIRHDVLYVHFMPDFYARFTVRPLTSVTYRTRYFSQTVSRKRPISRNSITFDPDRILGF